MEPRRVPSEITLTDFTRQAIATLDNGIEHFIAQFAFRIEDVAKTNLYVGYGVDTGAMQQSISAVTSEGSHYAENANAAAQMNPKAIFAPEVQLESPYDAVVQVPVDYAGHVEMGGVNRAPMPFLTPAVELVMSQAENIAREVFDV
jgi:hypothetical protein